MNSKELNLKLINCIPEISKLYFEETSWQEGDETGSHIVYSDVLIPFLKEHITNKNTQLLAKVFDFIEELLELNDEYASEVIALSFLESLLLDEDVDKGYFVRFAKTKTLHLIKEIIKSYN